MNLNDQYKADMIRHNLWMANAQRQREEFAETMRQIDADTARAEKIVDCGDTLRVAKTRDAWVDASGRTVPVADGKYTAHVYGADGTCPLSSCGAVSAFPTYADAAMFINGWHGNGFIERPDGSRRYLGKTVDPSAAQIERFLAESCEGCGQHVPSEGHEKGCKSDPAAKCPGYGCGEPISTDGGIIDGDRYCAGCVATEAHEAGRAERPENAELFARGIV